MADAETRMSMSDFLREGYVKLRNCSVCGAGYGFRVHSTQALVGLNTSCACSERQTRVAEWAELNLVVDVYGEDENHAFREGRPVHGGGG